MVRKRIEIDPRIGNQRTGLMVARQQIKTIAHATLEAQMVMDNSRNISAFGSCQKSGVFDNPLTPDQRKRAHQGVWGDAFSIVYLEDIGATDRSTDWADYVFDRIASHQLPEPTDLYAGSIHDARWYEQHFASLKGAPSYTRGEFQVWEDERTNKRIHILDRSVSGISASMVRTLIERRDPAWKTYVPAKLHDFYEWEYPPALRDAIELGEDENGWPGLDDVPAGTKGIQRFHSEELDKPGELGDEVFILRPDGKWRPRTEAENGKSMGD